MKNKLLLSAILLLITVSNTYTQDNTTTKQRQNQNLSNQNFNINSDAGDILSSMNQQQMTGNQFKPVIVDKAVNENIYIVGPNDVFSLGIYGFLNQQIPITVNVEGSVLIPTIGEIKVDGLTLKEAKSKVVSAVKKRYYSSNVSFTLVTPKMFLVTVSSIIQKQIEVNSTNRVSDLITYVYYDTVNVQRAMYQFSNSSEFFKPTISMRNIEVVHKDGSISEVDLYKYFYSNDDKFNPYLKEGDFVKVPLGLLYKNYISINGAVQLPGVYEYNKSDDLETLIGVARGFDFDAYKDSIVIYRTNTATGKFESIYLIYDEDKNFKINEYDRVFVKYKADYVKNYSVSVLGEVNIPGVYPIAQKNTRLKEIIEMAGGLKHSAYLPLSIVFRRYDEEYMKKDTAEILINMRANDLIISEKDKLSFERDVVSRRNRMVVDFEKLYVDNDSSQNIILEHQDVVYINDDKKIVYVYGQVENEGYVPYKPGEDFEYYIKRAGGYSLAADDDNTRIIKFNSRGWYKPEDTEILSGDFVYVPKKTPAEFKESLTIIATMIGVVASILTTTLLILQQNK
ncbi:MAG: SLBB domain-containing protein [Candidatus Kapaibacterium sp.]